MTTSWSRRSRRARRPRRLAQRGSDLPRVPLLLQRHGRPRALPADARHVDLGSGLVVQHRDLRDRRLLQLWRDGRVVGLLKRVVQDVRAGASLGLLLEVRHRVLGELLARRRAVAVREGLVVGRDDAPDLGVVRRAASPAPRDQQGERGGATGGAAHSAPSTKARTSASSGGSGVLASSGRGITAATTSSTRPGSKPSARSPLTPAREASRAAPSAPPSASSTRAISSRARPRMRRRVCGSMVAFVSACGVPPTRTMVWHTTWWIAKPVWPDAYPARSAPSARSSRWPGDGSPSPSSPLAIKLAPRSAAMLATGFASGVYSDSTACARAFIADAASSGIGADAMSGGSAITSDGRTSRTPSTPSGSRWQPVSSAPESVRGTPPPGSEPAATIAFAESITLPPPSATTGRPPTSGRAAAEASATGPGPTRATASAAPASAWSRKRSVVSSAYPSNPRERSSPTASSPAPPPNRISRSPSTHVKPKSGGGLVLGRRRVGPPEVVLGLGHG